LIFTPNRLFKKKTEKKEKYELIIMKEKTTKTPEMISPLETWFLEMTHIGDNE
jgi:hypothetical protein